MRLYVAAEAKGGEDAVVGFGWYQALRNYGIMDDPGDRQHRDRWPDDLTAASDLPSEDGEDTDTPSTPWATTPALPAPSTSTARLRAFRELPGFEQLAVEHLVAFGSDPAEAQAIVKAAIGRIEDALREALSFLVSDEAAVASGVGVGDHDEPF
jgi:hypothetical protein